ncbi:hypothetical protein DPMN_079784, partial [Dreissena polymorpha]
TVVGDVGCFSSNQVTCRNSVGNCIIPLRFVWNGTPCGSGTVFITYQIWFMMVY